MKQQKRIKILQEKVAQSEVEAYLVDEPINLLYLTGVELSAGSLIITSDQATLFVDGRYLEMCQNETPLKTLSIENLNLSSFELLGFDQEHTSYEKYTNLKAKTELKPLPDLVKEIRLIKDSNEIEKLKIASKLGLEGFNYVQSLLKEGITEIEVANQLEIFWKKRGAKGTAFDPIVAFGANSSKPHYHPHPTPLKIGDPVLIDIGVTLDHYHSDMTRVLFYGTPADELREIYEIVLTAQEKALAACQPGTTTQELDQIARQYINDKGFGPQFAHGLGHGIGLEVHEAPAISSKSGCHNTPLEPGMVITIEPGIYLPNIGGVRIEDTVVITKTGHENLTTEPKQLRIIR